MCSDCTLSETIFGAWRYGGRRSSGKGPAPGRGISGSAHGVRPSAFRPRLLPERRAAHPDVETPPLGAPKSGTERPTDFTQRSGVGVFTLRSSSKVPDNPG